MRTATLFVALVALFVFFYVYTSCSDMEVINEGMRQLSKSEAMRRTMQQRVRVAEQRFEQAKRESERLRTDMELMEVSRTKMAQEEKEQHLAELARARAAATPAETISCSPVQQTYTTDAKHKYEWRRSTSSLTEEDIDDDFENHGVCTSSPQVLTVDGKVVNGSLPVLLQRSFGGRRVAIVGDSITKQLFEWLILSLKIFEVDHTVSNQFFDADGNIIPSCEIVRGEEAMSPPDCSIQKIVTIPQYSLVVSHFFHYGIKMLDGSIVGTKYNVLTEANLRHQLDTHDTVVVNAASHFDDEPGHVFAQVVRYLRDEIRSHAAAFYMLALPTHFISSSSSDAGEYTNRKKDGEELSEHCAESADRHWTDALARGLLLGHVPIIDMYPVLRNRGAYHNTEGFDCGHYCYNYELFYPFWSMLGAQVQQKQQQQP